MLIREISPIEKNIIMPIISQNRHNIYSNIKFFIDADKLNNYYYNLFLTEKNVKIFLALEDEEAVGIISFYISDWDSDVFGIKMAKIEYMAAIGDYRKELFIKNKLILACIKYLNKEKVKHLSIKVEANDFSSIHAIEGHGFKIMDNIVTYLLLRGKKTIFPESQRWFTIEPLTRKYIKAACDLFSSNVIASHYYNDPKIPFLKIREMYKKWLISKYKTPFENDIFIAKRNNKVVGCSILSFNSLLHKNTGLRTFHRSLVIVEPSASGCTILFVNAHIKKRKDFDFVEIETQTYNNKTMSLMQKLNMQFLKCRYSFHKSL